ncbi:MAG: hypothetical protein A3H91_08690 [Gammaproteobacteria bacterium RIFCSPLOWO2_02_FULL_61_13]|nr:MAG: hypothetical protein A3H91_08690 [Gammaproteobacteria bacterium RIFCSPLOWO2_02_FULL_61_13]
MNTRLPAATTKRPAKVSVNADLLEKAKGLGINLSQTLEDQLAILVRQIEAQAWLKQNARAMDAFNQRIEKDGIWSDGVRGF